MTCVGIDVAPAHLDVALRCGGTVQTSRAENTPEGHEALAERLAEAGPQRVVLEATGGYERRVAAALAAAGLPARGGEPSPS